MYICICKGVTDTAIREAVCQGADRMRDLKDCLGVSEQCGVCAAHAQEVLEQRIDAKKLLFHNNSKTHSFIRDIRLRRQK